MLTINCKIILPDPNVPAANNFFFAQKQVSSDPLTPLVALKLLVNEEKNVLKHAMCIVTFRCGKKLEA